MSAVALPRDSVLHNLFRRLPPAWRHRGAFADTWQLIARSQHWSRERLDAHVEERLVVMLRHAARCCPYYRRSFAEHGMLPEAITSRADLARLPLVGREQLRDHAEEMLPAGEDRSALILASTGGSSGIPVSFYRHAERTYATEMAFVTRARGWAGLSDTSRELVSAGGLKEADGSRALWTLDRRRNSLFLSSDDLSREKFAWMMALARQYEPQCWRGYPSALATIAGYLLESGERFPLRAVFTSSETLYDGQRRRIESAFEAPVFDLYGHSERVVCAAECERHEGYHVFSEYGVLELLDESGEPMTQEGAVGEVVGTTLLHDYFPLIRYRTGDRAVYTAKSCSCGRPFPLILRPDGRLQELLVADGGRRISMTSVNRHDDLFAAVDQFQFHQREVGRATLSVVPGPGYGDAERVRILESLAEHCGEGIEFTIEVVETIEKTRIGKHRFLIQELACD